MRRSICYAVCDGCGTEVETNLNEAPEDWITLVPIDPGQMMVRVTDQTARVSFCGSCRSNFTSLLREEPQEAVAETQEGAE